MTLPIQVKPIMTQEKGEKHVFRKSKKYRTLCSVALERSQRRYLL